MSIYGNLGLNVLQNIVIDKTYINKAVMDAANIPGSKDDGIFIGRFVQINNGTASSANDNLTVWRKVSYGEYKLFANYNVKLPTIELAEQASLMGTDPTILFNSDTEHYVLTLPQMSSLIQNIDFSYSNGDTNTAKLVRLDSSTNNIINYQLKLLIDAIGKTLAAFNKYFENPPTKDENGLAIKAYNTFVSDYETYFQDPPSSADKGLTILAYNKFINQYNTLVNDYEKYFQENTGQVPTKYKELTDDYNYYFDKDTGTIGTFDKWKSDIDSAGIDTALYTDGENNYLLFPYQNAETKIWEASKINLNNALHIVNSTISIEDDGKTLAIV